MLGLSANLTQTVFVYLCICILLLNVEILSQFVLSTEFIHVTKGRITGENLLIVFDQYCLLCKYVSVHFFLHICKQDYDVGKIGGGRERGGQLRW